MHACVYVACLFVCLFGPTTFCISQMNTFKYFTKIKCPCVVTSESGAHSGLVPISIIPGKGSCWLMYCRVTITCPLLYMFMTVYVYMYVFTYTQARYMYAGTKCFTTNCSKNRIPINPWHYHTNSIQLYMYMYISTNHISLKKTGLDLMQSHPLHRTHFGQY